MPEFTAPMCTINMLCTSILLLHFTDNSCKVLLNSGRFIDVFYVDVSLFFYTLNSNHMRLRP